jgi:ADP-ribosylglycohydrolase
MDDDEHLDEATVADTDDADELGGAAAADHDAGYTPVPDDLEPRGADDGAVLPALPWLDPAPSLDRLATHPRAARIAGAVLGAAIGDALGHPTEFLSLDAIRVKWPPDGVTSYALYWERDGRRFAPYTDDTQMAEVVLRALLWSRHENAELDATMQEMARGFVHWSKHPQGGHRSPGNACMSGCRALADGAHWTQAGGPSAGGCGSVMRAYPFGLLFHDDLERAERWAVAHSRLTHGDPIALAACAAMAVGMGRALRDDPPVMVLSEMVAAACRYSPRTAAMMAEAIDDALRDVEPSVTLSRLEAWAAHEAIAAACYLFARNPNDFPAAVLEGANTPGDSDSIATLAGALLGARLGVAAIPADWIEQLERTDVFQRLAWAAALPS